MRPTVAASLVGAWIVLLSAGCGEVRFSAPAAPTPPPPERPAIPSPAPEPLHESFLLEKESGTLFITFAVYPSASSQDTWSALERNLERFVATAGRQLRGLRRIYLGIALDASLGEPQPVAWFQWEPGRTRPVAVAGSSILDFRQAALHFSELAKSSPADRLGFWRAVEAWDRSARLLDSSSGTVWNHLVYLRDYELDSSPTTRAALKADRERLVQSLSSTGPGRQSFSWFAPLTRGPGLLSELSTAPFSFLGSAALADWERGDPRAMDQLVSRLKAETSRTVLTSEPKSGSVRIRVRDRQLEPGEFRVEGSRIVLTTLWPQAEDSVEVEYEPK